MRLLAAVLTLPLLCASPAQSVVLQSPTRAFTRSSLLPWQKEKDPPAAARAKIDSQLLDAIRRRQGVAGLPLDPPRVDIDARGRALVDIRVEVTSRVLTLVQKLGGIVVTRSAEHRSVIARLPLDKLETLAADAAVKFIEPAADATTNRKGEK